MYFETLITNKLTYIYIYIEKLNENLNNKLIQLSWIEGKVVGGCEGRKCLLVIILSLIIKTSSKL